VAKVKAAVPTEAYMHLDCFVTTEYYLSIAAAFCTYPPRLRSCKNELERRARQRTEYLQ